MFWKRGGGRGVDRIEVLGKSTSKNEAISYLNDDHLIIAGGNGHGYNTYLKANIK